DAEGDTDSSTDSSLLTGGSARSEDVIRPHVIWFLQLLLLDRGVLPPPLAI
ncbi:hypothetical protein SK128_015774, partial [Halocaridina rubra]